MNSGGYVGCVFFFNDTATTEIYTLSLHDALPICPSLYRGIRKGGYWPHVDACAPDRKSTRLNSSHLGISYAVFCLKKHNTSKAPHLIRFRYPRPRSNIVTNDTT